MFYSVGGCVSKWHCWCWPYRFVSSPAWIVFLIQRMSAFLPVMTVEASLRAWPPEAGLLPPRCFCASSWVASSLIAFCVAISQLCPVASSCPPPYSFFFFFLKKGSFIGVSDRSGFEASLFSLRRAWPWACFKAWESLFPQLPTKREWMAFLKRPKLSACYIKGV